MKKTKTVKPKLPKLPKTPKMPKTPKVPKPPKPPKPPKSPKQRKPSKKLPRENNNSEQSIDSENQTITLPSADSSNQDSRLTLSTTPLTCFDLLPQNSVPTTSEANIQQQQDPDKIKNQTKKKHNSQKVSKRIRDTLVSTTGDLSLVRRKRLTIRKLNQTIGDLSTASSSTSSTTITTNLTNQELLDSSVSMQDNQVTTSALSAASVLNATTSQEANETTKGKKARQKKATTSTATGKKRTKKLAINERQLTLNEHLKIQNDVNLREFLKQNRQFVRLEPVQENRSELLIELRLSEPISSTFFL